MAKKSKLKLTVLHLLKLPAKILRASTTMRPAMTALVVAIAGMMLPAMAEVNKIETV